MLGEQFSQALTRVEVNGTKQQRAIEAHTEIQTLLAEDSLLRSWGINTRPIGSYSRQTAIYPGKDVDVFARFDDLSIAINPQVVYDGVWKVLEAEYGSTERDGRATQQARSIKVDFPNPSDGSTSFAVDVVPAVRSDSHWSIPSKDQSQWSESQTRWIMTDPERFGELSEQLNLESETPEVGGQKGYKPIVKLMRQVREVHLGDQRPGGLYVEFGVYDVWSKGLVHGSDWAVLLAGTLREVADRFASATHQPLLDPGLGAPVNPPLDAEQWTHASATFRVLADDATQALLANRCEAAVKWRRILGKNDRGHVFPLPPECDGAGAVTFGAAAGGLTAIAASRPREAQGFG